MKCKEAQGGGLHPDYGIMLCANRPEPLEDTLAHGKSHSLTRLVQVAGDSEREMGRGETKFVGCNLREETKYGFVTQSWSMRTTTCASKPISERTIYGTPLALKSERRR